MDIILTLTAEFNLKNGRLKMLSRLLTTVTLFRSLPDTEKRLTVHSTIKPCVQSPKDWSIFAIWTSAVRRYVHRSRVRKS